MAGSEDFVVSSTDPRRTSRRGFIRRATFLRSEMTRRGWMLNRIQPVSSSSAVRRGSGLVDVGADVVGRVSVGRAVSSAATAAGPDDVRSVAVAAVRATSPPPALRGRGIGGWFFRRSLAIWALIAAGSEPAGARRRGVSGPRSPGTIPGRSNSSRRRRCSARASPPPASARRAAGRNRGGGRGSTTRRDPGGIRASSRTRLRS